ncbi:MAG: hypothetical protein P8K65_03855 [Acidimicrobiales bacterium]|nr:hypothetical protein [Acidimicrobiales bacterium]
MAFSLVGVSPSTQTGSATRAESQQPSGELELTDPEVGPVKRNCPWPEELVPGEFGHHLVPVVRTQNKVGRSTCQGVVEDSYPGTRPAANATIDRGELVAYLREHLAPHRTPRHWFHVDQFPLTGSSKIQKFVLRDQWRDGQWTELA